MELSEQLVTLHRFVLRVAESHGFYFTLYCAYFASDAVLGLLSLAHWPGRGSKIGRAHV